MECYEPDVADHLLLEPGSDKQVNGGENLEDINFDLERIEESKESPYCVLQIDMDNLQNQSIQLKIWEDRTYRDIIRQKKLVKDGIKIALEQNQLSLARIVSQFANIHEAFSADSLNNFPPPVMSGRAKSASLAIREEVENE